MKLDYSLKTIEERQSFINTLLSSYTPSPNELSLITDYLLFSRDKDQTIKERSEEYPILTPNRQYSINKRQLSYEGLIERLENGEDGLYSLISDTPEIKLDNKDPITPEDIATIPGLSDNLKTIEQLEWQYQNASPSNRKILKKSIIETWKQIYTIKSSHKINPPLSTNKTKYINSIQIPEEITWDSNLVPSSTSPLSLLNLNHISFLLKHYEPLKRDSQSLLDTDMYWHLIDLEYIISKAFKHSPLLRDILFWKIQNYSNKEIKQKVLQKYNQSHTEQYYSTLWRQRIPKIILKEVQKQYITHYYLNNYKTNPSLNWKTCSKCGRLLPAHPFFFPRNSNKEGFYSQCRECRKKKGEK